MALPKNKKLPSTGGSVAGGGKGGDGKKGDGKSGKNKGGMPKFYGGLGGYKGVKTKTLRRLVNGILREEIGSLRSEKRGLNRETRSLTQAANRQYRRGKGDLNHVFGETSDYLNHLRSQSQQQYAQQASQAQAAQAALQQSLGGTYSGAQQAGLAELERLGVAGGGNFSQLQSDAANAQAMAQQAGANAQSTMNMAAGNADALAGLLQGMNQGAYQSHIGKNLTARNEALAEIGAMKRDGYAEIRDAIREAKKSRGDVFFQLLQQLQQTGWNQYVEQQQLKRNRRGRR